MRRQLPVAAAAHPWASPFNHWTAPASWRDPLQAFPFSASHTGALGWCCRITTSNALGLTIPQSKIVNSLFDNFVRSDQPLWCIETCSDVRRRVFLTARWIAGGPCFEKSAESASRTAHLACSGLREAAISAIAGYEAAFRSSVCRHRTLSVDREDLKWIFPLSSRVGSAFSRLTSIST